MVDEANVRVLLAVSQEALDRARALAGKTTVALRLPVSLQVVLRALIEEGLKRADQPALLASIERHAHAVRERRRVARSGQSPTPRPRAAGRRRA
jgi:hypothetical protein